MDANDFFEYLGFWIAISAGLMKSLTDVLKIQDGEKNTNLLKAGQFCDRVWFLRKGIVRWHHTTNDKDITTWIQASASFIIDTTSLYSRIPGKESIETIENSSTYYITYKDLNILYRDYPEFQDTMQRIINEQQINRDQHAEILRMSAKKKYDYFLKTFSGYKNAIPIIYLASFLNMSTGTFYKLRNRISKNS